MSAPMVTQVDAAPVSVTARFADYVQMARPKLTLMVLITTLLGALLAASAVPHAMTLAITVLGTGLVSAGASLFNQFLERRTDARMRRTENRPLPTGRVSPIEAVVAGTVMTLLGLGCLAMLSSGPAAAILAAATFMLYVFVYTPAKQRTWWNTFIGAVPGALPPLIGWAGVTGSLTWKSLPLFAMLFFWQVPHFLAIAWIYRDDYRRAGSQMLPVLDPSGHRTLAQMAVHTVLLTAASLVPLAYGAGWGYAVGALGLGLAFLGLVGQFDLDRSEASARAILRMSLVYLPSVLGLLTVDHYW